jgi:alkylated DNA repair protein (DNA oxidative demethylase)
MKIYQPRTDFIIVEDFFTSLQASVWLQILDELGGHPSCGYHHPLLKPNRFHKNPKYPVKKFMCLGLYWNPLDYLYYERIPENGVCPHPIPEDLKQISTQILKDFYPTNHYYPQSVMVNFYTKDSSMGLHVDKDEPNKIAPIIGLNFGSTCRFFFENESGEIKDTLLPGNSIYVFGKSARHMRHGLGTIFTKSLSPGSELFLKNKERVNLTIRQVL